MARTIRPVFGGGVEEAGGRGGRDHFRGVPGGPRASSFWPWGPWDRHWGRDDPARRRAGRRRPRTASIFREGEERSPSRLCDSQRDEGEAPRPFHAESIEDRERRNRAPDDLVLIFCSLSASRGVLTCSTSAPGPRGCFSRRRAPWGRKKSAQQQLLEILDLPLKDTTGQ